MIQRVDLENFKAFERFALHLQGDAYLAGPNNAGKSTLIRALGVAARMVRIATRRKPADSFDDGPQRVIGYPFTSTQVGLDDANLRHEFRDLETRLTVRFRGGSVLRAVWPTDDGDPFFYLQVNRLSVNTVRQAREAFPEIAVIPVLAPVEDEEELLTPKYVRENLDGRLASRHFRNQLRLLGEAGEGEDLAAFYAFAEPWLPEIKKLSSDHHMGEKNFLLDLYYTEAGRRAEKEVVWAGDGIQIWLQLLLHVFRNRSSDVSVLDEPDVFLHPDLQRRLVRLLESLPGQTITATHSSEVLVEAAPESIVWVDKVRRKSVRAPDPLALASLSTSLGSQFNIRLARALRAKCVLFVEGDDAKILRRIAEKTGALRVATETGIAVIPLNGYDNWAHVEPFSWMAADLLEGSVPIFTVLDRDYHPETSCREVVARMRTFNVKCHIWKRKELESYLIEPETVARVSGCDVAFVEQALTEAAGESEDYVFGQVMADALKRFPRDQQTQAATEARRLFTDIWSNESERKWVAPPDRVLAGLNRRLAETGKKPVSFGAIAGSILAEEVAPEMTRFLDRVEEALDEAGVPSLVR